MRSGARWPSTRSCGGLPVVRWRSDAPFSIIAFSSWCRFAIVSSIVFRGDAVNLAERGHALHDLVERAAAQRAHALADRLALDLGRAGAVEHELLQRLREDQNLVDGDAALEAGVGAEAAAGALHGPGLLHLLRGEARGAQLLLGHRRIV